MRIKSSFFFAASAIALLSTSAQAELMLTSAGTADGFSLSTFATGFSSTGANVGPTGVAVNSDGKVIVNSSGDGKNYVFNNTDGQTTAAPVSSVGGANYPAAYAFSNGAVWGSTGFNTPSGQLIKLNNDGTTAATYANIPVTLGLWTNPVNGHLIGSGSSGLVDINVSGAVPTYTVIPNSHYVDGVSVSPDGKTVYTNDVAGYNIATGAQVLATRFISGADGTGVISGGALNGDILVNTNFGELWLIDPLLDPSNPLSAILIANNGSRGDYTAPDALGHLFVTQSDRILRLSLEGATIGGSVPEPSTWAMMILGFAGIGFMGYRRRNSALGVA
jgi:hypothetical protein